MPNNRQLALLIYAVVVIGFALLRADLRKSLLDLTRCLLNPNLLVPMLTVSVYVGFLVIGGYRLGWWDISLTTDTAFWMVASGVVLFFNSGDAIKKPRFFSRTVRKLIGWTVVTEFLVGLTTGPLWLEMLLPLALTPVVILHDWGEARGGDKRATSCLGWLLSTVGLTMILVSAWSLVRNFESLDKTNLVQQLMLPMWLTVGSLPLAFVLGVYMHYETVGIRSRYFSGSSTAHWFQIWLAVFREHGFRATQFDEVLPHMPRIARADGYSEARKAIQEIRREIAEKREERKALEARLERFAGVGGSDDQGLRLDRREFAETCASLSWLHTCHMGWWNREERYKTDLLELIGGPTQHRDLSVEAGYREFVASDGSAWFAWRRTISNWVFAIGAAGPPPDQWLYDGPEPPQGPPRVDDVWGDSPFSDAHSRNWVWGESP